MLKTAGVAGLDASVSASPSGDGSTIVPPPPTQTRVTCTESVGPAGEYSFLTVKVALFSVLVKVQVTVSSFSRMIVAVGEAGGLPVLWVLLASLQSMSLRVQPAVA